MGGASHPERNRLGLLARVITSPSAGRTGTLDADDQIVGGYPGIDHDVQTYSSEKLEDVRERKGSVDASVVRVYGEDMATLRARAHEVQQILGNTVGVTEAFIESRVYEPQVEIDVDLAAAERYGIKLGDVRRAAATLVQGLEVGSLYEEQKVFQVVVLGLPNVRGNVTDIENLRFDTPVGGEADLAAVADVRIASNPSVIQHEAVARYIEIEAYVADLRFPLGWHAFVHVCVDVEPVKR